MGNDFIGSIFSHSGREAYVMNKILIKSVSFILVTFYAFNVSVVSAQQVKINTEATDFTLEDLEGNKVALKDFKGRPLLLFFWATWCPHCQRITPQLIELKQKFSDKDFEILAIDFKEDKDKLKRFAQKQKINYKILLDKQGEVFGLYNIPGVPVVIVVDRKGIIQFIDAELPQEPKELLE